MKPKPSERIIEAIEPFEDGLFTGHTRANAALNEMVRILDEFEIRLASLEALKSEEKI